MATKIIPTLSVKINIKNLQIADKLDKVDASTVGGRVKYYRTLNKMSVAELSKRTGYSAAKIWEYEEGGNYCTFEFCIAVANALDIDVELLCDEYTLFLNSGYIEKIVEAKDKLNMSYAEIAEKYGISSRALLSWVQGKYVPSRESFEKYIKGNSLFYHL